MSHPIKKLIDKSVIQHRFFERDAPGLNFDYAEKKREKLLGKRPDKSPEEILKTIGFMKTILLLLISSMTFAQPRMLQITPEYYLDTKEVTFKNIYGLDYHFDENGFIRNVGGKAPEDILLTKSDSTKKVYIEIPYQTFISMSPADWQKWQNQKVADLFYKKLETSANFETTYGTPRKGKILKPGGHTVNYNDPNYLFYSGNWTKSASCECAFSKTPGDFIELTFNSNSIKVIGEKTTTHGKIIIELDGVNVDTVDLYNASMLKPFTVFERSGLAGQQHTIRLIVMEAKYVVFSKAEVSNSPPSSSEALAQDDNPQPLTYDIKRNGYWVIEVDGVEFKRSTDIINASQYAIEAKMNNPGQAVRIVPPNFTVE